MLEKALTAYFNDPTKGIFNEKVDIVGGFQHQETGHHIEITSSTNESIPRQSISIWKLSFGSKKEAERIIRRHFGRSLEKAQVIDHAKGIAVDALEIKIFKEEAAVAAAA